MSNLDCDDRKSALSLTFIRVITCKIEIGKGCGISFVEGFFSLVIFNFNISENNDIECSIEQKLLNLNKFQLTAFRKMIHFNVTWL